MNEMLSNTNLIIHNAGFATVSSEWSKTNFPYPYNRIYYITEGSAILRLTDGEFMLQKGFMYFLPAFLMVEAVCEHTMSHFYIHCQIKSENSHFFYRPKIVHLVENTDETIRLFQNILSAYSINSLSQQMRAQGALYFILSSFFDKMKKYDSKTERFLPIIQFIQEHFSEKMQIKTLADMLKLDPVYFSNVFTKTFDMPPKQYIIKRRLEYAQLLLANTSKKIKQIALESGFENEMYFSRVFKQKTGLTPGKYKETVKST